MKSISYKSIIKWSIYIYEFNINIYEINDIKYLFNDLCRTHYKELSKIVHTDLAQAISSTFSIIFIIFIMLVPDWSGKPTIHKVSFFYCASFMCFVRLWVAKIVLKKYG